MVVGREGACTLMVCAMASSGNFSASVLSVPFQLLPLHVLS